MNNWYDYKELYVSSPQTKTYDQKPNQLDIIDAMNHVWKTSSTKNLDFSSDEKKKEYELLK